MSTSCYDKIQLFLINQEYSELENYFARLGKHALYSHVMHLDFGLETAYIKELIHEVVSKEDRRQALIPLPLELKEWVKTLHTKRLLKMLQSHRMENDHTYLAVKAELKTREHVPRKLEARVERQKKAKKKTNKLELQQKKIRELVATLRQKGYSVSEVAQRARLTTAEVMFFLKDRGLEDKFVETEVKIEEWRNEVVGYYFDGEPVVEGRDVVNTYCVSRSHKPRNSKGSYSEKFGIKEGKA